MRHALTSAVLLGLLLSSPLSSGTAHASAATEAAAPSGVPRYSIEQFMDTERIIGASFSPDGEAIAYSSNRSGVINIYEKPLAGGEPVALTASTGNAILLQQYFPGDRRLLYSSDNGGDELDHVYVREIDGSIRDLTPGEKLKASFLGFNADGSRFWISSNERDSRYNDVYEYDASDYSRTLLYRNDDGVFIGPISPDGRLVALSRVNTRADTDILLFDRQSGTSRVLIADADAGDIANRPATFSADGRALYYTSDRDHGFSYLLRHDLASGEATVVLKPDWDVTGASRSRGSKYLSVAINQDSTEVRRLLDAVTHAEVALPQLPARNVGSITFSADDSHMAMYVSDSRVPNDLFLARIGGGAPQAITRALNPAIDAAHLVDGEVVRFKSYDGLEIPGVLYRPKGASAGKPVPMIIRVHGGPGGQAVVDYNGQNQYMLNHGYALFDINNRGSSGYGKAFYAADDRCHGECDLGDVVAAKSFLAGLDWVDGDRIGIMGRSYGGFMVAAALAFEPDAFKAGVNIFGVTNWVRTLESIPPWWEAQRIALYTEMGDPAVDGERLRRISPLLHAGNIRRPLMVLQGANDPRVLQVESDELVAAVRANDVPVDYVLFPDEGHGFRRRDNEIEAYRRIREFMDIHLSAAQ